jgi:hypothetical protein
MRETAEDVLLVHGFILALAIRKVLRLAPSSGEFQFHSRNFSAALRAGNHRAS